VFNVNYFSRITTIIFPVFRATQSLAIRSHSAIPVKAIGGDR